MKERYYFIIGLSLLISCISIIISAFLNIGTLTAPVTLVICIYPCFGLVIGSLFTFNSLLVGLGKYEGIPKENW